MKYCFRTVALDATHYQKFTCANRNETLYMSKSCHRISYEYLINLNFRAYDNVRIRNIEE